MIFAGRTAALLRLRHFLIAGSVIAFATVPARAQRVADAPDPNLPVLTVLLAQPEKSIDLARAKLTVDRMIDASVDIEANLRALDALAREIEPFIRFKSKNVEKTAVLQDFLYKPGPWNANKVFEYDLDDPFGKNIRNKLLPTYLSTRRGNCVSMPMLMVILGQKLGVDVRLATAPLHVFVKYRDDSDGKYHSFEATSGGPTKDSDLQRSHPMTDKAIANGVYLRPLSKKEAVLVMIGTLIEHYGALGLHEQRMKLAELILAHDPKSVTAMIAIGHAYYGMSKRDFIDRYPSPAQIPIAERPRYQELKRNNNLWYERAEALGWTQPDAATETQYQKVINQAKSRKKGDPQ